MKSANVRRVTVIGLIAAISLIVAACGSSSKTTTSTVKAAALPTSWELPGADAQNTRDVGGPINSTNVSTLGVAWTVPIVASGTFGAYATTPVVSNGVSLPSARSRIQRVRNQPLHRQAAVDQEIQLARRVDQMG